MDTVRFLVIRLIAVLAAVGAVVVATPGTATAGGPTSVLLASPSADAATGLYYTDADYARLQTLLGGSDLPTGVAQPPAAAGSPYVTATWLIHDVYAWRIDRIFLAGDEVWVVSEMSGDGGPLTGDGMYPGETGNAGAVWHRPTDPAALTALLTAHGLTPESARSTTDAEPLDSTPLAAAAPIQPAAASSQSTAASSPSAIPTSLLWGLGGLLAGLLLGGALVRVALTRSASVRSPAAPPGSALPTDPARMQPLD